MTKIQENTAKLTESDLQLAQSRAEVISYVILAEVDHFNHFRVGDFKSYLQKYIRGQIDFYKQVGCYLTLLLRNNLPLVPRKNKDVYEKNACSLRVMMAHRMLTC